MLPLDDFKQMVARVREQHLGERICFFQYQGKGYWLKQTEHLQGAMRVLKANPHASIQKEIQLLAQLNAQGAAVPLLMDSGDDYLVVADAGKTLKQWLGSRETTHEQLQVILNDASQALAKLHSMSLAHGRPALRDISWQAGEVKFIDFEANQAKQSLFMQQIRDLLIYIHSLYRYLGPQSEMISEAISQYRRHGGEAIWQKSKAFVANWQWLYYIARPFRDVGGKDLKPIYWVLWHFRQTPECI
ncbi:phosphotransferase [Shewanella sp. SR44-3]|uniref:phosphotransferase n=1 Tax=unclassified Shewanella TaxID=196818 RepID=UPI0015FBF057|nr:phosphotransferase [Shewanella sp. SR44-3]MBB1270599.1 phosphotransferase [Shewanella sp. SR44-3]